MDLILHWADELLLDKVYAKALPLSAFSEPPATNASAYDTPLNTSHLLGATSIIPSALSWAHIVSSLPHPPLPAAPLSSPDASALSAWPRDYIPRQLISLAVITLLGIVVLYFLFAGLSYQYIFNHDMKKHPRFLKNQIRLEIQCSLKAFPGMTLLTRTLCGPNSRACVRVRPMTADLHVV